MIDYAHNDSSVEAVPTSPNLTHLSMNVQEIEILLKTNQVKVKQPILRLPAFNVIAEIFSFLDFKDVMTAKLRLISKKTSVYCVEHKPILAGFLIAHEQTLRWHKGLKM